MHYAHAIACILYFVNVCMCARRRDHAVLNFFRNGIIQMGRVCIPSVGQKPSPDLFEMVDLSQWELPGYEKRANREFSQPLSQW